jgi:hypothetical protein
MRHDREQDALAKTASTLLPRAAIGEPTRAWARLTIAAAVLFPACTVPIEGNEANGSATQNIDEVVITIERPCTGCAEREQEIASAMAQAQRVAMAEAEARARDLRRLTEARIVACISARVAAVNSCNAAMNQIAAGAAATRAECNRVTPCFAGDRLSQIDTCTAQGWTVCDDNLHSCLNRIPIGAPGIEMSIIAQAVGACYGEFGTPCSDSLVPRNCGGANNFGGFGSARALCSDFHQTICAEPEANTIAQALKGVAECLTLAFLTESQCLGHPTMQPM